ncbi:unnamed protein product, partial [Oppiella nova]
ETKAVDTTARDPEPVVATKSSNRSANARNANKEAQAAAQQQPPAPPVPPQQHMPQPAQPSQPTITQLHPQQPTIVTNNNHHPMPVNQTPGGPTHVLQAGTNIVLGPSGINYTTAAAQGDGADSQRNPLATNAGPKVVLLQGSNGPQYIVSGHPGQPLNIPQEFLNHIQFQSSPVITQSQPSVLHHTSSQYLIISLIVITDWFHGLVTLT